MNSYSRSYNSSTFIPTSLVWAVAHVLTINILSSHPIFHRLNDALLDFLKRDIVPLYSKGLLDTSYQSVGDALFTQRFVAPLLDDYSSSCTTNFPISLNGGVQVPTASTNVGTYPHRVFVRESGDIDFFSVGDDYCG
jgi:hypothetical protein